MMEMKTKHARFVIIGLISLSLLCVALYQLPAVHSRLSWRLASLQTKIHYFLNPPDQVTFSPNQEEINQPTEATPQIIVITPSPTVTPTQTYTPRLSPTPTLSPTLIPASITLTGIPHEYQSFNNCGPANLSMLLNFWGWEGDQRNTRAILRPHEDDSNVMPEEMAAFIENNTDLTAIVRYGGDIPTIKKLVAAGFSVIIEKGLHPTDDWWMGHYLVVNGYSDEWGRLITQDSLIMADFPIPYQELETQWWRDFNYVYLVAFPPEREAELISILGENYDQEENRKLSLSKVENEIPALTGRDLFFAYLNQAENLYHVGQKESAAQIYDIAFSHYNTLDEKQRPWRVLWYRVNAYQTYYDVNRYQSVIDLASITLAFLNKPGLEESHYWRGMAYEALGENEKAHRDYEIALQLRPTYQEALDALSRLK